MKWEAFRQLLPFATFSSLEASRFFLASEARFVNLQLSRWVKTGRLQRLKRGLYLFPDRPLDELVLAGQLYAPSYLSCEAALSLYGLIPETVANLTSVTPLPTKKITTPVGTYLYSRLTPRLFWGFHWLKSSVADQYYALATPEKAYLDYCYLRRVRAPLHFRVDLSRLNRLKLKRYEQFYH